MGEQKSAAEIGERGYTYWSKLPVTPDAHEIYFVRQTVVDSIEAYCSCGEYRSSMSIFDAEDMFKAEGVETTRQIGPSMWTVTVDLNKKIIETLTERHRLHCEEVMQAHPSKSTRQPQE